MICRKDIFSPYSWLYTAILIFTCILILTLHLVFSPQKSLSVWVSKHFFSLLGSGPCQANHRAVWKLKLATVMQIHNQNPFKKSRGKKAWRFPSLSFKSKKRQEKGELIDNWNLAIEVNKAIRIIEFNGLHLPVSL